MNYSNTTVMHAEKLEIHQKKMLEKLLGYEQNLRKYVSKKKRNCRKEK